MICWVNMYPGGKPGLPWNSREAAIIANRHGGGGCAIYRLKITRKEGR